MAWSGGTFSRVHDWTTDEAGGVDIESVRMDAEDDNFQSGINDCIHKSGQNAATGDLPMGGNNHTGVGNATAKDEYASAADLIDQDLIYYVDTGAADAYVITPSPSIGAYEEGQRLIFRALAANTGASTLNVNGLGATALETNDGSALTANMIIVGGYYEVTYDANGSRFVLTSPHSLVTKVASTAEAQAETSDTVYVSPLKLAQWSDDNGGIVGDLQALAAPAADRMLGYDWTAGEAIGFQIGEGLTTTTTTLKVDIAGTPVQTGLQGSVDMLLMYDNSAGGLKKVSLDDAVAGASGGVPDTRNLIAGNGLTGGGTLDADRTFDVAVGTGLTVAADSISLASTAAGNGLTHTSGVLAVVGGEGILANANDIDLDITSLTNIEGGALASADEFLVYDASAAEHKVVSYQEMGLRTQYAQSTAPLVATDMNSIMEFNAAATVTIPLNSGTALPTGCAVMFVVDNATAEVTITAASGVTLNSVFHPGGDTAASDKVKAGGTAVLIKTDTNEWYLSGDIKDS